jgi:hypothetical protein
MMDLKFKFHLYIGYGKAKPDVDVPPDPILDRKICRIVGYPCSFTGHCAEDGKRSVGFDFEYEEDLRRAVARVSKKSDTRELRKAGLTIRVFKNNKPFDW